MKKFAVTVFLLMVPVLVLAACGDDDDGDANDERLDQLGSTAEAATYAYAADGAAGLYDYVAQTVKDVCTIEQFEADLESADVPTSFRGMDGATFDGDSADATLIQIFDTEDRTVVWTFVDEGDNTWRVTTVPEQDECAPV
jgi:hypothetical protein